MKNTKVAIIGAGLAGLYVARALHRAGVDILLIEARERIGGRIFTADAAGSPTEDGFDLGPSWYWPEIQPAIAELVAELGLSAFAQNSEGDVIFERMSRESRHRYRSAAQSPQSMRLAGGSAALVRALAKDLPEAAVLLGTRAKAMVLKENGVVLNLHSAHGEDTVLAERVVVALPPRLLDATVDFTPQQEEDVARRWRETATWMAPHAKFFALYDRPFWREDDLSGTAQSMVGPMVEMHDATTASGAAALFGFLGVPAPQRAALGEATLTRACIDQLARIFGPEAAAPKATLFKDWAADPLTATPVDLGAAGHILPSDAPWVRGPWAARLTLAGSETSASEPGYLAGAVDAARRAVEQTLIGLGIDDREV
ncbi:flavin monoamine oxidase family protein [Novosphingobium terrae]|uniref:flavin monoamine oxidase family protein n=1 Tax=Novosphingobium terrae TaxID=2726189 RepID=UPI0019823C02|nr:FAD-dependent oxidoreductase [Novosphingobium terrae]